MKVLDPIVIARLSRELKELESRLGRKPTEIEELEILIKYQPIPWVNFPYGIMSNKYDGDDE